MLPDSSIQQISKVRKNRRKRPPNSMFFRFRPSGTPGTAAGRPFPKIPERPDAARNTEQRTVPFRESGGDFAKKFEKFEIPENIS